MRNRVPILTAGVLFLALALATIVFLFWRLGILKKEPELSQNILTIKEKIEFISNYPFANLNNYLQNLSTQIFPIPQINPDEIGRPSLF